MAGVEKLTWTIHHWRATRMQPMFQGPPATNFSVRTLLWIRFSSRRVSILQPSHKEMSTLTILEVMQLAAGEVATQSQWIMFFAPSLLLFAPFLKEHMQFRPTQNTWTTRAWCVCQVVDDAARRRHRNRDTRMADISISLPRGVAVRRRGASL